MTVMLRDRKRIKLLRQWQLFRLALMFFTRIPVGQNLAYSEHRMNQANRYFSLVGWFVGALVALGFYLFSQLFPVFIALLLTCILSVLLTGAFHEDGLADMADGIGGGYTTEQRLAIMKDSRLGTYGAITLVLALLLKLSLWFSLANHQQLIPAIMIAYALSRAVAASLIYDTDYVSDNVGSKSKPLANKQSKNELFISLSIAIVPSVFLFKQMAVDFFVILVLLVSLVLFRGLFKYWITKRIGGFTGDCLGGAQQLSELIIYLVLVHHIVAVGAN
ncbi:adenosylcobinamide-GDP ribazoletransferase [Thalassotalea sp. G2M2-11]|uniref:adenosylcobinamide-GDP ribazoletransferase n=1 Tax=Thalassotalea sp. G2M2-11 TaxID=2787627 RepID=UPI001F4999C3|nr:adenosylcobinamide-GDP ribazoletransferase [Thalassotalea sp. G2M2-11]